MTRTALLVALRRRERPLSFSSDVEEKDGALPGPAGAQPDSAQRGLLGALSGPPRSRWVQLSEYSGNRVLRGESYLCNLPAA